MTYQFVIPVHRHGNPPQQTIQSSWIMTKKLDNDKRRKFKNDIFKRKQNMIQVRKATDDGRKLYEAMGYHANNEAMVKDL